MLYYFSSTLRLLIRKIYLVIENFLYLSLLSVKLNSSYNLATEITEINFGITLWIGLFCANEMLFIKAEEKRILKSNFNLGGEIRIGETHMIALKMWKSINDFERVTHRKWSIINKITCEPVLMKKLLENYSEDTRFGTHLSI